MAFLKHKIIIVLLFVSTTAQACPSCLAANNGRFFNQTLIGLAVMGILPLVLAAFIGFRIYRLCQSDSKEIKKGV